jgi:hypothetical protein
MDIRLHRIFGDSFRLGPGNVILTPDGREVSKNSRGIELAEKLLDIDPEGQADEIIKLMIPFCRRFDISKARQELQKLGKKQKAKPTASEPLNEAFKQLG